MDKGNRKKITIISIMTYYARQIFNETKTYEFRKSPLKNELLNQKIYVYSAKEDKAIIGYFKVSDILKGNTNEILKKTGYDQRLDGQEIVEYYGINNPKCFALKLYEITEFKEYLSLKDMRNITKNVTMPQYIKFIYDDNPLYEVIQAWDKAFSITNTPCNNPVKTKQEIFQKAKKKGRKYMEHKMKLQPEYYNFILNGTKRIEIRLNDEKRQQISLGDTIEFLKEPELNESFKVKVIGLLRYNTFEDMFKDFDITILSDKSMAKKELITVLEQFYPKEKQNKYGVLGIRIELL